MLQDKITQTWVARFGKKVTFDTDRWIFGPTSIEMYRNISLNNHINKDFNGSIKPAKGIINSVSLFNFTKEELHCINPLITDFYTNTVNFNMDIRFNWNTAFKPVAHLVKMLFSKRLQQMNIPIIPSDELLKTNSFIVKIDENNGLMQNFWVRKLLTANQVIFSGIYSVASTNKKQHLVKVQFPLPNGNATIFLEKKVLKDGNLELSSKGLQFGDSGFYFFLKRKNSYYAKYVKCMHEKLTLTVENQSKINGTHEFYFYGIKFLTIDYLLCKKEVL